MIKGTYIFFEGELYLSTVPKDINYPCNGCAFESDDTINGLCYKHGLHKSNLCGTLSQFRKYDGDVL